MMKDSLPVTRLNWPLLLMIALSLALNLHALAGDSFWGDEILTASFAGRSPAEVIHWTAEDIHPPLYYLLAGGFTRLLLPLGVSQEPGPASDWLWRFPSVIAVALTVAISYKLAFYLGGNNQAGLKVLPPVSTARFAALLMCLAPVAIKYGQEARMHALFMAWTALSTYLFFRAMHRPQQWLRWLAFALVTTANLYTMYFGFLILAAQGSYLLATSFSDIKRVLARRVPLTRLAAAQDWPGTSLLPTGTFSAFGTILRFSLAVSLAFLLYLPWWPVLFAILRKRAAVGAIEGGVGSPLAFIGGVVTALGPAPVPAAWGFLLLFGVGLFFLARYKPSLAVFAGLWLALPVMLPVFLGDPRALQFRYAFVLPVYLAVVAYAVACLSQRAIRLGLPAAQAPHLATYLIWLLGTISLIGVLAIYQQVKPDWRGAAAYLNEHALPADLILIGPLWDEGRFIGYYYRGEAQLLTPAALVDNIERRVEGLRAGGGRIWAVNRFAPAETAATKNIIFPGVVISEPQLAVYEPELLAGASLALARQAAEAAYPWAAETEAQGILNPDPRTAKAAALRALGDTLMALGRPAEAVEPYQVAVTIFPGWTQGFIALAEAQEAAGNLPAAAAAYQEAVHFNLEWQGAQANQAAALVEAHNWPAALELYRAIIGN